jgi:hypothetical protein
MSHSPVENPFPTVSDTRLVSEPVECRKYLSIPTSNNGGQDTCQNQKPTGYTAPGARSKGIPAQ